MIALSTISFLRKGNIWKPDTKVIIVNIILWLIYAGTMIAVLVWGLHMAHAADLENDKDIIYYLCSQNI